MEGMESGSLDQTVKSSTEIVKTQHLTNHLEMVEKIKEIEFKIENYYYTPCRTCGHGVLDHFGNKYSYLVRDEKGVIIDFVNPHPRACDRAGNKEKGVPSCPCKEYKP